MAKLKFVPVNAVEAMFALCHEFVLGVTPAMDDDRQNCTGRLEMAMVPGVSRSKAAASEM